MALDVNSPILIPPYMVPSFRTQAAIERKVEQRLMLKTWGGLGDQICAEPTLRFALRSFKGCEISLASEAPELFSHLPFERVFNLKHEQPLWDNYLCFDTIVPPTHLLWEFMCHMLVNCVDFPSLCAFRCQLPVAEREVRLAPSVEDFQFAVDRVGPARRTVVVHAGRHWQSKTFPADWWNEVLRYLIRGFATPVLIGANTCDNRGTVDVDTTGCLDLRNRLTTMQSVALLQRSPVLLTNDSAPLHMAVAGDTWIGFVATCKHPDYIKHWRQGSWGWRMENFGLGGIWDVIDYCPNKAQTVTAENVGDDVLRSWLPDPTAFAEWALEKL